MPSGAKKRKAAKRKKELGIIHLESSSTNNNLQGNGGRDDDDDLISHDGKGSESGDFASTTSQDSHPLEAGEGEEEEEEKKKRMDRDSAESGGIDKSMDSSENGGRETGESSLPHKPEEVVSHVFLASSAVISISEPEVVNIEHFQSDKDEDVVGSGEAPPPVEAPTERVIEQSVVADATDLVDRPVSISEEVVRTSDVLVENPEVSSVSVAESPSDKYEEKVVSSTDAVSDQPRDSVESFPGTESREITGITEPQVVLSTQAEHRASWMSCCGLFDALMGSRR